MRSQEYLKQICSFEHRGSFTLNEKKASRYIENVMGKKDFKNVEVQKFKSANDFYNSISIQSIVIYLIIGVLFMFKLDSNYLSIALIIPISINIIGYMGMVKEINFMRKHESQNIIAHDEFDEEKPTVVFCAHYDTQKNSELFNPKLKGILKNANYIIYTGTFSIIMSIVFTTVFVELKEMLSYLNYAGVLITILALIGIIYSRYVSKYVNGANDNGTGTAMVIAMADKYKNQDLNSEFNYMFLFLGAHEAGLKGMKAFIKEGKPKVDRKSTYFINIDMIGEETLVFLKGEGLLINRPCNDFMMDVARKVNKVEKIQEIKTAKYPTDSLPLINVGFKTISFSSVRKTGEVEHYHRESDKIENVKAELMIKREEVFKEYLNVLTKQIKLRKDPMNTLQFK